LTGAVAEHAPLKISTANTSEYFSKLYAAVSENPV